MIRIRTILLILGDFLLLSLSYMVTVALLTEGGFYPDVNLEIFINESHGLESVGLVVVTLMLGMYFLDLYENTRIFSRSRLLEELILVFGVSFLLQGLVSYVRSGLVMARWIMMGGSLLAMVVMVWWRWIYSLLLVRVAGRQKVLFLGDTPVARRMAEYIVQYPQVGFQVVGCVADHPEGDFPGGPWLPFDDKLDERVAELKPDRITVSGMIEPETPLGRLLLRFSMRGLRVELAGSLHERLFYRVSLETITPQELVFSNAYQPAGWLLVLQDLYCWLLCLVGLIVSFPVMLLVGLAVALDSPGPVILRQTRLSKGGVPFALLKFRSMFVDADKRSGPVRAKENDPRVTRVGRWIRLTRLDELPQFWNVLRGDMSLVGPRPEMPELERQLLEKIPLYQQRHRVKPGITGWAQIHHEPEDSTGATVRKLEYDLYYIKNLTPVLDFMIIFHTVKAVLLRIGAR